MKFEIYEEELEAYNLKDYIYKGLEIQDYNKTYLICFGNIGSQDTSYKILDYPLQKLTPASLKDINIPDFTIPPIFPISDKIDIVLNTIYNTITPISIYESRITFNYLTIDYAYSLSQNNLDEKIKKIKINQLKEYRKDLLLKDTFNSKLKAIETIHEELKLNSSDREDNLENIALESFVDNFIKGFDEDAGLQMIFSGKSSSLLNRNDKDQLSEMQRKYFELIDSDPNITYKKLEEFSASLFSIHREGIRHYKKLKKN